FPQPPNTQPRAIVTGADGNLWYGGHFPESFEQPVIGRITTDGTPTRFLLPPRFGGQGFGFLVNVVTLGSEGHVWYGQSEYTPGGDVIGHISPDGQATSSFIAHDRFGGGAQGGTFSITVGPDGNIWFVPSFLNGH